MKIKLTSMKTQFTTLHNGTRTSQRDRTMKTRIANRFPCLGVASRAAWACLGVASMRSRVLSGLMAGLVLMLAGPVTAQTFTTVHIFTGGTDGAQPVAGLVLSGNTLFGTTHRGGDSAGDGTVFSLSFPPPQLTLIPSGPNLILRWPANYAGFEYTGYTLQSTTNLAAPVWTTVSPGSVVVDGQNTVTNPVSGTQQFYRLALLP